MGIRIGNTGGMGAPDDPNKVKKKAVTQDKQTGLTAAGGKTVKHEESFKEAFVRMLTKLWNITIGGDFPGLKMRKSAEATPTGTSTPTGPVQTIESKLHDLGDAPVAGNLSAESYWVTDTQWNAELKQDFYNTSSDLYADAQVIINEFPPVRINNLVQVIDNQSDIYFEGCKEVTDLESFKKVHETLKELQEKVDTLAEKHHPNKGTTATDAERAEMTALRDKIMDIDMDLDRIVGKSKKLTWNKEIESQTDFSSTDISDISDIEDSDRE